MVVVERLTESPSDHEWRQITELLRIISPEKKQDDIRPLSSVWRCMGKDNFCLVVARDTEKKGRPIVGMASYTVRCNLTSLVGWIDHVIVHHAYQRMGVANKVMDELVKNAVSHGLELLNLACNPERKAAHRFYQSFGFEVIAEAPQGEGTNLYKLDL